MVEELFNYDAATKLNPFDIFPSRMITEFLRRRTSGELAE
jgi:hypothetical protein